MKMSLSDLGYCRIAVASPELRVADVAFNGLQIRQLIEQAERQQVNLLLLPELGLTGYTCADLFFQPLLIEQARQALLELADFLRGRSIAVVVGAPVCLEGRLFNCGVMLAAGSILGLVPKSYLPNTQEFYEERWFSSARELTCSEVTWQGNTIPVGTDLLFQAENRPDCRIGIEICEDAWVAAPPSGRLALRGATVLLNLSASPEILSKEAYRRDLVRAQSARCLAAYAYASAGPGESSTDLVFSGHSLIAENGQVLAETERFQFASQLALADLDLQRLVNERIKNNNFILDGEDSAGRIVSFLLADLPMGPVQRSLSATPFVPALDSERCCRCREIFSLQTTALAKRLRHTGSVHAVIGLSGGLDSTLALLVTVKAYDRLQRDRKGIVAVTMPGFGTTARTRGNAELLAELLGVSLRVISIDGAVRKHFEDIGHDETCHDITYENAQARERTQILMDLANQLGGLVIGTGDLSELALGWCTYNADHMSMYGVNAGVPKTLVRYLVEWCAEVEFSGQTTAILNDICATPVSPELLPPTTDGEIRQKTEDQVGPYLLHDFFLYHMVRLQFPPQKIYVLACQVFADSYAPAVILHWLKTFYRRFFSQQFKRSCLPDGPKVGSVALSPRGDWRMPSDACATLWLEQLEQLEVPSASADRPAGG
ncbi:MAG: NAD(+) synthase [Desulfuromonadaceae bacterium]